MAAACKIIVADDDPALLQGLGLALRGRGYSVRTAGSGTELLSLMEADRPDLVIVDVAMPGMTGLDVLREVRAADRWPGVPVMVITALADAGVVEAAEERGAAAVLAKPFRLEELLGGVRRCLSGARCLPVADQPRRRRSRSSHS